MTWYEKIIAVHREVTDSVSHVRRLNSERYFVWQEDGDNVLHASNNYAERAMQGSTDLYTKIEFDPWVEELGAAFDKAEISYHYTFIEYEEDTGFYHHSWDCEVLG